MPRPCVYRSLQHWDLLKNRDEAKNQPITKLAYFGDHLYVTNSGGTVKTEIWGRRRMAYEINKQAEGIYAIVDIQAEPAAVAELDRQLNLNESVLRTKLMRPEVH